MIEAAPTKCEQPDQSSRRRIDRAIGTADEKRAAALELSRALCAFSRTWGVPKVTLIHLCARAARLDARGLRPVRLVEVAWSEVRVATLEHLEGLLNSADTPSTARGVLRRLAHLAGCTLAAGCFGTLGVGETWAKLRPATGRAA